MKLKSSKELINTLVVKQTKETLKIKTQTMPYYKANSKLLIRNTFKQEFFNIINEKMEELSKKFPKRYIILEVKESEETKFIGLYFKFLEMEENKFVVRNINHKTVYREFNNLREMVESNDYFSSNPISMDFLLIRVFNYFNDILVDSIEIVEENNILEENITLNKALNFIDQKNLENNI